MPATAYQSQPMAGPTAGLGPFFEVDTHDVPPGAPWRPMGELVADPQALREWVTRVRVTLASNAAQPVENIEFRVAASVAHLGLTARLIAPALRLATVGALELDLILDEIYWQPVLGGPFPLSIPNPLAVPRFAAAQPGDDDGPGGWPAWRSFLARPVADLVSATASITPLSPHVLWGNVASAIQTAGQLVDAHRPDLSLQASAAVAEALAGPLLREEHTVDEGRFRRRSCCLIYRIADARARSLCEDCALVG